MTLLLTAPFGHGTGDHVSFRHEGPFVADAITEILMGYSCYPPAIPKILECLRLSGRYDCVLQSGWFRSQYGSLVENLKRVGVTMEIFELCQMDKRPLTKTLSSHGSPWLRETSATSRNIRTVSRR